MKNANVAIALILAVALVVCAVLISLAIRDLGHSVERASNSFGQSMPRGGPLVVPSAIPVKADFGEIRVGNAGGGQSFRVENVAK